jgi:hypothetical protein
MASVLLAIAAFAGVTLLYKVVTAGPNPAFDDPDQEKLVELLIADATGTDAHGLENFIRKQRWGGTELRNRLIHARNSIRLIAEPAVFQRAKQTVRRIILKSFVRGPPYYDDP